MIDAAHAVQLNGVLYKMEEVEDANHYVLNGSPLRPPNAVLVQGEDLARQKFQIRPDVLVWSITDWSGGEGQVKFDPQDPSRQFELTAVDPFSEPGKLLPGYLIEQTTDSLLAALNKNLALVLGVTSGGAPQLWGLDKNTNDIYLWDDTNGYWGSAINNASGAAGACDTAGGDAGFIYWKETSTDSIWSYDGSSFVEHNNDTSVTHNDAGVYSLGDYIYLFDAQTGKVFEIPKTGTAPVASVLIDDPSDDQPDLVSLNGESSVAIGANRLYSLLNISGTVVIRMIVPTSAAGAGYGVEIARLPGVYGESIWWSQGRLLIGVSDEPGQNGRRALMYVEPPDGQYGTLGFVREEGDLGKPLLGAPQANTLLQSFFATTNNAQSFAHIFGLELTKGGFAMLGSFSWNSDGFGITSMVHHKDQIFFSPDPAATASERYTYRMDPDTYQGTLPAAISPWHDFGLSDQKVLSSIVLHTENLPADWTITIDYEPDGNGAFIEAGTYSTTGGTGTRIAVSTDTTTRTFRNLRIRIRMTYSGGGNPTTRPKVLGIDVRAQVLVKLKVWNLLLDCRSDKGGGTQSFDGETKITNIIGASDAEDVIAFLDGYPYPKAGDYDEYDVVIDEFRLFLTQPGEGYAQVKLIEVP